MSRSVVPSPAALPSPPSRITPARLSAIDANRAFGRPPPTRFWSRGAVTAASLAAAYIALSTILTFATGPEWLEWLWLAVPVLAVAAIAVGSVSVVRLGRRHPSARNRGRWLAALAIIVTSVLVVVPLAILTLMVSLTPGG